VARACRGLPAPSRGERGQAGKSRDKKCKKCGAAFHDSCLRNNRRQCPKCSSLHPPSRRGKPREKKCAACGKPFEDKTPHNQVKYCESCGKLSNTGQLARLAAIKAADRRVVERGLPKDMRGRVVPQLPKDPNDQD
jgi:acetyl-CoA carboxylase beta subunit